MLYFAYGSNLSSPRLLARVSSATAVTTGQLQGHRLLFHKIGRDGSAKCNALYTGRAEDLVFGTVFRIDPGQREQLDRAEARGLGYEVKQVLVSSAHDGDIRAFTYFATRIDPRRQPFHWYKEHVLRGMREYRLAEEYIRNVEQVASVDDPDPRRADLELGIYRTPRRSP